ncbi:MAG TPA: diaminopimelate epimerase [Candidatus Dormibacteraeota bacterium]|jgi:diaminopimelate epimerase|nr:diaminopimelate epimerase [Candidatus Dormibacteraeota bacterium]
MRFEKMHGLGNDFLVVDDRETQPVDWPSLAQRACERHTGVGADGILLIQGSDVADLRMRLFNADGSEAEMCGNGIRCVAQYVAVHGISGERVEWETGAGRVVTELVDGLVTVDMGPPRFAPEDIPAAFAGLSEILDQPLSGIGMDLRVTCVSMGNPHCAAVVDDVDAFPLDEIGPLVVNHLAFPQRTNFEIVQVLSRTRVRQRTFERGVGETNACGTGASAVGVAMQRLGLCDSPVTVELRGGPLYIAWAPGEPVRMTGPAQRVYTGHLMLQPSETLTPARGLR